MILIHPTEFQSTLAENDIQNIKLNQVLEQQAMKIIIGIKMVIDYSEHFRHKLSSQNTRNGVSENKDFKLIGPQVLKAIP